MPNGMWKYRVTYMEQGKRKTKTKNGFRTKKEAQMAVNDVEVNLSKGNSLTAGEAVFVDYFEKWYSVFRKGKHSWKNDRDIEHSINIAKRFFKKTKIKEIDRTLYQKFINDYSSNHATATVKKVHTYVKACLKDALNDGVIYKDPTYNIKVFGQTAPKDEQIKFLNESEIRKLLGEIKRNLDPDKNLSNYIIIFGIATGCRFSEILGMTWDCIDFKNETITINKSWDHLKIHDFSQTKNYASLRTINLDLDTLNILKSLQKYQMEWQMKSGLRNIKNLVFANERFKLNSNNAVNKVLKNTCTRLDIYPITMHALRHTHASVLLYHNLNIKYVSRRLGHTDIVTTLKTYGHILDELDQRESTKTNEIISSMYN